MPKLTRRRFLAGAPAVAAAVVVGVAVAPKEAKPARPILTFNRVNFLRSRETPQPMFVFHKSCVASKGWC